MESIKMKKPVTIVENWLFGLKNRPGKGKIFIKME